jgi:mevalonate kinase
MPAFSISAPGKIILFGEHAVVYGQPAIAVPVNQIKAKAIVKPDVTAPAGRVGIQAPQVDLDSTLAALPASDPIGLTVAATLEAVGVSQPPAFILRITSTIPIASGLGSGAAVSVAIIRAVSGFLGQALPDERVSALAFEIEKIHHGTPSGIDNTVIAYSRPVYFIRERPIETLEIGQTIKFIIADTGIASPTAATVGQVRRKWETNPGQTGRIFEAIGSLTRAARDALLEGKIKTLGTLMDENHQQLQELAVSSPELDHLVTAARRAGGLGAKLSGGGQGGNIITLVPNGAEDQIGDALRAAGAVQIFQTLLRNPLRET